MDTLIKSAYEKHRKEGRRALQAFQWAKSTQKLEAWRKALDMPERLFTDRDNVAHEFTDEKGYRYVFKLECDYDNRGADDMKHQGYDYEIRSRGRGKPDFAEHGEFTRYSGNGFKAWLDLSNDRDYCPAVFDVPEIFVRQFYDAKLGRAEAYRSMVERARKAIESDVKIYCKTDYYYISVTVFSPEGEEIESDGLSGVDDDYAQSGQAFFDHGCFERMQEAAEKHFAETKPESVPENFAAGAFI